MYRTASMESTTSAASIPLLPLPQGKTVYLGTAKPAPFPPLGMNHIYEKELNPSFTPQNLPINLRKGKSISRDYFVDSFTYAFSTNFTTSKPEFIPPEKLIIAKSSIEQQAQSILTPQSHKALLRAYQILRNEDKLKDPDGQSWTHKFRPRRADEILPSQGLELRDWMIGNRKIVMSIIPEEMDDFIDDDDYDDDDDDDESPRKLKKDGFIAYSNVVILTGPHGVGKSATVGAIAEELGYQVFEISPGSRRGGKELMEAVGEVGQSELITKNKEITTSSVLKKIGVEEMEVTSHRRKGLICLDEVDVLYEEDKGFWGSVTALVEKSRRPIIMTCNGTQTLQIRLTLRSFCYSRKFHELQDDRIFSC
jgi:hypothetical protein